MQPLFAITSQMLTGKKPYDTIQSTFLSHHQCDRILPSLLFPVYPIWDKEEPAAVVYHPAHQPAFWSHFICMSALAVVAIVFVVVDIPAPHFGKVEG